MNPRLSLIIGIICIAFSAIFVKLAGVLPVTAAFYRIAIAWLLLMPYCLLKGKVRISQPDLWRSLLAGVVFASDIAVWNMSILKISATVSTLVANLAPVWVGLLSWLFLKKLSGAWFWLGTAIAIAGMVILVGYRQIAALQLNEGVLLAILSSMFYAVYIILTKGILQRIDTVTFMFYNMLGATLFLLAINGLQGNSLYHFPPYAWYYLLGMTLICQLGGWLTINYAIMHLPAAKTSVALLSQTVVTALIAAVLLHERLTFKEIAGSVVVLTGIGLTFLKPVNTWRKS